MNYKIITATNADSPIPKIAKPVKATNTITVVIVISMAGNNVGNAFLQMLRLLRSPYGIIPLMLQQRASFFEEFNKTLYAPPLRGCSTTSPYIFLNKNKTTATNNNEIHAYCPAYIMVRADTYKQEE
jgi:hypothetical protein